MQERHRYVRASSFREASEERWKDANCLHEAGRFDGAIYLCGYVLECFLKFALCERKGQAALEIEEAKRLGHNLFKLLHATRLSVQLSANEDLWVAFQRMNKEWSPEIRYRGRIRTRKDSRSFLDDTKDLRNWLQTRLRQ